MHSVDDFKALARTGILRIHGALYAGHEEVISGVHVACRYHRSNDEYRWYVGRCEVSEQSLLEWLSERVQ
jgi:hypothetical protein